jgi:hypothetical protein
MKNVRAYCPTKLIVVPRYEYNDKTLILSNTVKNNEIIKNATDVNSGFLLKHDMPSVTVVTKMTINDVFTKKSIVSLINGSCILKFEYIMINKAITRMQLIRSISLESSFPSKYCNLLTFVTVSLILSSSISLYTASCVSNTAMNGKICHTIYVAIR